MFSLLKRIFNLFGKYRLRLAVVSALVLLPRLGDLLVPFFAARVFDALASGAPAAEVNILIVQAAAFWILHGNVMPFVSDWFECRFFGLPARQHISEFGLGSVLKGLPTQNRQQHATMHQAVLEEGENRLMIFVDTITRTALPGAIMSICALAMILWWIPMLGAILLIGGALDLSITMYANTKLKDRYAKWQDLSFCRQRQHREIFNNILGVLRKDSGRSAHQEYSARYTEMTGHATATQTLFFGFRLSRDVVLNVTNALTWLVGAWCVYNGLCTIGLFMMVIAWSARATELFGLVTLMHKAWLDNIPAIRAFFSIIDNPNEAPRTDCSEPAPVAKPAVVLGLKQAA